MKLLHLALGALVGLFIATSVVYGMSAVNRLEHEADCTTDTDCMLMHPDLEF